MSDEREAYGDGSPPERPSPGSFRGWAICRFCGHSGYGVHVSPEPRGSAPYTVCPWCSQPLTATIHAAGRASQTAVFNVVCDTHGFLKGRVLLAEAARLARCPACEKRMLAEREEREPRSRQEQPPERPREAPPSPPRAERSAERPPAAPPSPPRQTELPLERPPAVPPSSPGAGGPPEGPGGTPPSPPPPGGPPRTPNAGDLPRAAWPLVAVVALLAVIGVIVYLAFSGQDDAPPPVVIIATATPTPTSAPTPTAPTTDLGPTPAPSPIPTAAAMPTAAPAPTATPTVTASEAWQAAEKAVREALAAYEAAEGEERVAALVAYEAAITAEAHAFAVWQGLPTPTPRPLPSPTAGPAATGTPTPTAIPRPTSSPPRTPGVATPTPVPPAPTATAGPEPPYAEVWASLGNSLWLQQNNPALASAITSLRWVADGIDVPEREGVQGLVNLATFYRPVFSALIGRPWVADGLNESETEVVQDLRWVAYGDQAAALRLLDMPFLEVIEAADADAVDSLRLLAYWRPQDFQRLLSHPTLSGGISDFWAQIVALLNDVSVTNPKLIDVLLDPGQVTVEERTVSLPLAGNVDLAIIRTGPGALRSMDLLEDGVRRAERFMAEPFPTRHVALLFEETVSDSSPGANLGSHIAVRPEYDVGDEDPEANAARRVIARQATRYYWNGNRDWVDEGASDFMASIAESARTGLPVDPVNPPCAHVQTIAALERLNAGRGYDAFDCADALGERLFLDLYLTLGDGAFRQGFRNLYLMSEVEDVNGEKVSVGIDELRVVFQSYAAAIANITARWYDGIVPHDESRLDPGPVDARLTGINGGLDRAFVSPTEDGAPVSSFSAAEVNDLLWLTLEYSYRVLGGPHETRLEVVERFEDGFAIRRQSVTLTAEEQFIGEATRLRVGVEPAEPWAPGRYWVYVYENGRKVAEVEYEVVP